MRQLGIAAVGLPLGGRADDDGDLFAGWAHVAYFLRGCVLTIAGRLKRLPGRKSCHDGEPLCGPEGDRLRELDRRAGRRDHPFRLRRRCHQDRAAGRRRPLACLHTGPRQDDRLLLAVDVPEQAQPRHRPEACRRPRRAVSAPRRGGCLRHQLSAARAGAPENRRLGSAAAQSAADLRLALRLRRAGRGSRENGLRLHRLLGANRVDGHGAGDGGYRARALRARHGRPPQRDCTLCRDRDGAVPAGEDRQRRRRAVLLAAERPVGECLLRPEPALRRAHAASRAARERAESAGQSLSLPRRALVHHGSVQRAAAVARLPGGDRLHASGR